MKYAGPLSALSVALLLSACGGADQDIALVKGENPKLVDPERGLLPSMTIADPVGWGDKKPTDRKSTRLNSSHMSESRMPSSA